MKLEVGKKYRLRNGDVTTIVDYNPSEMYVFQDSTGRRYTQGGDYYLWDGPSPFDIIEEFVEVKPDHSFSDEELKKLCDRFFRSGMRYEITSRNNDGNTIPFEESWQYFKANG